MKTGDLPVFSQQELICICLDAILIKLGITEQDMINSALRCMYWRDAISKLQPHQRGETDENDERG